MNRFAGVDALRGLIMMIMAIDHTSACVARQHGTEFWNGAISIYTSAFPFLTRWVTHLCAPGFFFLMGAGIYWFAATREAAGWSRGQIVSRTALRGLVIFLTGQVAENAIMFTQGLLKPPAVRVSRVPMLPPLDGTPVMLGFIVLAGLGMVMIACAVLLRLKPWTWLLTSAGCVVATNTLLPGSGKVGSLWETILLAPGVSHNVVVTYPLIPWLGVSALGMYFGYWWKSTPQAPRRVWMWGAALLLTGVAVRALGGWGNIQPARDGSWIEFLNNVKYPPSLVFWTMAVGIDLLILAGLNKAPQAWLQSRSPLIVFGQAPLFFYVMHFAVLTVMGLVFFPEAASLEMAYAMWLVVLAILYPLCLMYRSFKLGKPAESWWRLF